MEEFMAEVAQKRLEEFTIAAKDGFALSATLYHPENGRDRPPVLINPAFGVKRAFYAFYARFLAQKGYPVLTFDYRGMGGSAGPGPEKVLDPMHSWATYDIAGVQKWIEERYPSYHLMGHSGGGWLMAFLPQSEKIRSMVFLAVPDGYWKHYSGLTRFKMLFTWLWTLPRHVKKNGALMKGRGWYGETLPPNVALDWAKVCRYSGFIEDESLEHPAKYAAQYDRPTLAFSFEDDEYAPTNSSASLLRRFRTLKLNHRHIHPRDLKTDEIGHFGFLKPNRKKDLWEETAQWFDGHSD